VITAVLAIAAGISAPVAASSEAQLKTAASRVVLAVVTDAQDRPLVDLGPDDFAIAENGSEREIVSVYVADYPVVVLLDEGTTATKDVQAIRSAVVRFISRLGPRAVAISTLSNPPAIVASFEDDRAAALARLEGAAVNPTALLAPLEAVSNAVHLIGETGAPFSAIVVVSARPIDTSQPAAPGLSQTIFESGAFVNVVVRRAPETAPSGRGSSGRADQDLLRDLSDQTHGQYITVFSAASYSVALDRLADRLATEMMIQYLIPSGAPSTADVRVGVKAPGARVRGLGVSK
jgi:hypothetical protein